MDPNREGILCRKDRKFYYLETGHLTARNSIDRLRGILINRGLISYHRTDPNDRTAPYKIIKAEEASEKGLDIEVIYISKHIEQVIKARATQKEKANPWRK